MEEVIVAWIKCSGWEEVLVALSKTGGCWRRGFRAGGWEEMLMAWMKSWGAEGGTGCMDEELGAG